MTLSASDLQCIRTTANSFLPGTAVISRASYTTDGMGGSTDVWTNVGTVSARVSPNGNGIEEIIGGGAKMNSIAPWIVTVPVGTSINERDKITYANQTFEVVRTDDTRSYATNIRIYCNEVT